MPDILVGFANNVELIVNAYNAKLFDREANPALVIVERCRKHVLDLAVGKTEDLVITKKRVYHHLVIMVITASANKALYQIPWSRAGHKALLWTPHCKIST